MGARQSQKKALPFCLQLLLVNLQLHELSPFEVFDRYHVPFIVEERVELYLPLFLIFFVHNFISEDLVVLCC